MHAGALRALEFDRIVEAVRRFALTPAGAARLAQLAPADGRGAPSPARLAPRPRRCGFSPTISSRSVRRKISNAILDVAGRARAARSTPSSCSRSRPSSPRSRRPARSIRRARGGFPVLRAIADRAASFEREIADVRRKIDPGGEVVDDASPELKSIRDRLRKQRARLRGTLESYLRGKDTAKYLQQQIVTDRNGRYVLVVRSEHRTAIPGIVHGSSGSGASLFLEPLSTVEINNDIVALEQQEAEEVRRILLALTDALPAVAATICSGRLTSATELDVLQARAQFSIAVDGVAAGDRGRWTPRASRRTPSAVDSVGPAAPERCCRRTERRRRGRPRHGTDAVRTRRCRWTSC